MELIRPTVIVDSGGDGCGVYGKCSSNGCFIATCIIDACIVKCMVDGLCLVH